MSAEPVGLERLRGKRVVIWGAGREGLEVARTAMSLDAHIEFVDDMVPLSKSVKVDGFEVPVASPESLSTENVEVLVRSPGVSVYREELARAAAAGCEVTSATAMWFEDFSGSRIVGVTGTKGKTTTAWLCSLALEACGLRVALGGNMGTPLTALYSSEPADVYVLEVSSFQAADLTVSPPVGVLTLLAPDHLDWHRGYENYVRDKLNLFDHRPEPTIAVNSDCPEVTNRTERYVARLPYGGSGTFVTNGGTIFCEGEALVDASELPLRGRHNLVNLCGALTACSLVAQRIPGGRELALALERLPVLPSRLETVATAGGVEYVNDALASNPAGTVAALRTFAGRNLCLIAGGQDRGVELGALVREMLAMRPVPVLVSLPGLGRRLARELTCSDPEVVCVPAETVPDAVLKANDLVSEAGVVLFSPAAPTPVVEGSYVQRGALFNETVTSLVSSSA